jgi:hypothetical protein
MVIDSLIECAIASPSRMNLAKGGRDERPSVQ